MWIWGYEMLQPVAGSLSRVLPIVLAHHDKFDGIGYHNSQAKLFPWKHEFICVADVYDAMTSDRPYRKAMSPFEAKETIVKAGGSNLDPEWYEALKLLPPGPDGNSGNHGLKADWQQFKIKIKIKIKVKGSGQECPLYASWSGAKISSWSRNLAAALDSACGDRRA